MVTTNFYYSKTHFEKIYMGTSAIINCSVFGYLLNKIGIILDNINKVNSKNRHDIRLIERYMMKK